MHKKVAKIFPVVGLMLGIDKSGLHDIFRGCAHTNIEEERGAPHAPHATQDLVAGHPACLVLW